MLDHRARRLAQSEMVRPLVVEAGAGTGKTATLVARVLAWSLGRGWTRAVERDDERGTGGRDTGGRGTDERVAARVLRGVVAITFTEAAAAEMADRVTAALALLAEGGRPVGFTAFDGPDALDAPDPATLRRRAAALLATADLLEARTIHSFCRKLLAEHPFEAGLHPHFTVDADGSALGEVVEEAVAAGALAGYGDPGDADYLALAGRGSGPLEIAELVSGLAAAGLGPEALAEDPFAAERRAELASRLFTVTNRLQTLLETRRVAGTRARNADAILDGLGLLRRHLRQARRAGAEGPDLAALGRELEAALPANLADHLRLWARGETPSLAEKERLAGVRERLMPLADELYRLRRHVLALDPELLGHARRVAAPLLERVRGEMRRRGVVGFADLLRGARTLLAGHPALAAQVRRRIDQLLVDEFQDTDAVQCELIRRLALSGPAAERPGLFVVGDPKQSIYGWRSADLEAYEGFVAAVEEAGGERLPLDENFRSRPEVLAEVERLVAPVMVRRPGLQPEFRPLKAAGGPWTAPAWAESGERAVVEHWLSWTADPDDPARPAEGTVRITGELEARALAADLVALRRRGVAFSDVGVLLRSLTDVEVYLQALREAGVPFVVSRDRQYFRRREVLDATALARAVLLPEDELALVTFLRSSAVGVPDAAWLGLWAGGLPRLLRAVDEERLAEVAELARRVAAELPAEVPGLARVRGWERNLAWAAECLAALRRSFADDPVDVFVDRLRRATLFEAGEAARYLGAFRRANLERFFTELLTALVEADGDRHRVLRRLERRIAQDFEAEEARPAEAADDAVRVMTIHKAKGLEFAHVYLLETHKEAGRRSVRGLELGEVEGKLEYRLFGAATPAFDRLEARRDEIARAELVRTLYVATTRAAERLVIAGRPPLDGEGAPLERATTHMDLLVRRGGEAPSWTALAGAWAEGEARREAGGVLWRLVGREEPPAPEEAPADDAEAPELATVAEVASRHRRLSARRTAAAERMVRPMRQVASKLGKSGASDDEAASVFLPPDEVTERLSRESALAAGSAIHRLLEAFDLAADPEAERERQASRLASEVSLFASGDAAAAALERAERLWHRFAEGELWRRFVALRESVVARELPVAVEPSADDEAVGHLAGIVDLLYRDPADGEWVVADYKTDLVESPASLAEHVSRYAAQGGVYTRAIGDALGLEHRPRFELWFLDADRVEVVP